MFSWRQLIFVVCSASMGCVGQVAGEDPDSSTSSTEPARSSDASGSPERSSPSSKRVTKVKKRVEIADGLPRVTALAQDKTRLFVATGTLLAGTDATERGGLFVVDKTGSEPLLIAADGRGFAFVAVAVTRGVAFVATADGRIVSVPTRGGDATLLLEEGSDVTALMADEDHVYAGYASGVVVQISPVDGTIVTFSKDSAPVRLRQDDAVRRVTIADSRFHYFVSDGTLYREAI